LTAKYAQTGLVSPHFVIFDTFVICKENQGRKVLIQPCVIMEILSLYTFSFDRVIHVLLAVQTYLKKNLHFREESCPFLAEISQAEPT
jgi:hypothetical protein